MRIRVLVGIIVGLGVVLLACNSAALSTPTVEPEPPPTTEAQVEPMSLGQELFISRGCSTCHGQNAEGTVIAPALPGHTIAQVKRQARAPMGIMPVFPPDKVSNEELEAIAEFIGGLEGHIDMSASLTPDALVAHHWMAMLSIEADDVPEAVHHLKHIIELTEGRHRAQMEKAITLLDEGSVDEGTQVVEQMLAGLEQVSLDVLAMHLTLALSAARVDQVDVTENHVKHFIETATGEERGAAQSVLSFLQEGRPHHAVDALQNLLGQIHDDTSEEANQIKDEDTGADHEEHAESSGS